MRKRIILGLLVGVLLLFFTTSTWAVDAKRAKLYGRPDQEFDKIPVTPQTINTYPSIIKFIFIPNIQNFPVLIYINKSSIQTQPESEDKVKNSTNLVKEQNER